MTMGQPPDTGRPSEPAPRERVDAHQNHSERLQAARQRVAEHPATRLLGQMQTLRHSIDAVFMANFAELVAVLRAPSENFGLALELVQNVRHSPVAERYEGSLVQRVHNYLAGTYTLVEHTRAIMTSQSDELNDRWRVERERRLGTGEVAFVSDLRRYVQHCAHLPVYRRLSMSGPAAAQQQASFTLELSGDALRAWEDWLRPARQFIGAKDSIALLPLFETHFATVVGANRWVLGELAALMPALTAGYNELVVQANAVLTGLDVDQAREFTERRSRQDGWSGETPG